MYVDEATQGNQRSAHIVSCTGVPSLALSLKGCVWVGEACKEMVVSAYRIKHGKVGGAVAIVKCVEPRACGRASCWGVVELVVKRENGSILMCYVCALRRFLSAGLLWSRLPALGVVVFTPTQSTDTGGRTIEILESSVQSVRSASQQQARVAGYTTSLSCMLAGGQLGPVLVLSIVWFGWPF